MKCHNSQEAIDPQLVAILYGKVELCGHGAKRQMED